MTELEQLQAFLALMQADKDAKAQTSVDQASIIVAAQLAKASADSAVGVYSQVIQHIQDAIALLQGLP
jgi:CHASE3 domain sensor protein